MAAVLDPELRDRLLRQIEFAIDDEPDETVAAVLDALARFDARTKFDAAKHPRVPSGHEGGGRFRKLSDTLFEALKDWLKGDKKGDPFLKVLSPDPAKRREQIRRVAKERGITLRRGATYDEIAKALFDDLQKDVGKVDKPEAPKRPAVPKPSGIEKARARQAKIDDARKTADVLAEASQLLDDEVEPDVLRHRIRASAKRLGTPDNVRDELLNAADDPEKMRDAIRRLAKSANLSEVGGDKFDRKNHTPIGGDIPDGSPVQVVRPGYDADIDGEKVRLSKAIVEKVETPKKRRPDDPAPGVGPVLEKSTVKELSIVDILQGQTLTPASRRALDSLGPAGHPAIADIDNPENKIRAAVKLLQFEPYQQDAYVSFENLRKVVGNQLPKETFDDAVRHLARLPGVYVTSQHYARENFATRIPAAVTIGGQENDHIAIEPPGWRKYTDIINDINQDRVMGHLDEAEAIERLRAELAKIPPDEDSVGRQLIDAEIARLQSPDLGGGVRSPKKATTTAVPDADSIVNDPALTIRQKRARLRKLGFTEEQIDQLAPSTASKKVVGPKTTRAPATPVPVHDLLTADDATIKNALRDVYEGKFGPYTTKVTVHITRAGTRVGKNGREYRVEPSIGVSGDVYDADGRKIGYFGRGIEPTTWHYGNGMVRREVWVEHSSVHLEPKYQGKGFGAEFNRRAIDWYRASGIHGISQNDQNGYVWASQGFGFGQGGVVPDYLAENMRQLVADLRARKTTSTATKDRYRTIPKGLREASDLDAQINAAEALLRRLKATKPGEPGYPTAYEISQLGRRAGQRGKTAVWFGRLLFVSADELILNPDEGEVISQ